MYANSQRHWSTKHKDTLFQRLFSSSSTKRSREVNKEIKNTLDKASHEKEEVRDEIIEKVNEHFKVITPRLIRSKKFVDENLY